MAELSQEREAWHPIMAAARRGNVTLLYSARDEEHNAAMALRVADMAYVLETGVLAMSGPASELLKDARVRESYLGIRS